jgi:hypothetical protein
MTLTRASPAQTNSPYFTLGLVTGLGASVAGGEATTMWRIGADDCDRLTLEAGATRRELADDVRQPKQRVP